MVTADNAAPRTPQPGQERGTRLKNAGDVGVELLGELLRADPAQVHHRHVGAGGVHGDGDVAVLVDHLLHGGGHGVAVGQVDGADVPDPFAQLGDEITRVGAPRQQHQVVSLIGEEPADRLADPSAGPGDECQSGVFRRAVGLIHGVLRGVLDMCDPDHATVLKLASAWFALQWR